MFTQLAKHLVSAALLLVSLGLGPAAADEVQRIAAIVNDEVVSGFDVERRLDLIVNSTRLGDTPEIRKRLRPQVLRTLVDEKLQLQEARRNNIEVTEEDLARAFAGIARQNNVAPEELERMLQTRGINKAALEQQLRAEIAWSKLVQRRLQPTIVIGEEEIDEALTRLKNNAGRTESRVLEIFLPVDSVEQEEQVLRGAERLVQQLREGAPFPAVARQFSRNSTAAVGGDVGWVYPGQLATDLDRAVQNMQVGEISDPIRSVGGYYILMVQDRRRLGGAGPLATELTLSQIVLAPEQQPLAQGLIQSVSGCGQVEPAAKEHGLSQFGSLGTVKLGELPENIRGAVADLAIGQFSRPIETEAGLMLLMVCERVEPEQANELPDREAIAEELGRRRAGILAQRYLRDLRRAAVVELR